MRLHEGRFVLPEAKGGYSVSCKDMETSSPPGESGGPLLFRLFYPSLDQEGGFTDWSPDPEYIRGYLRFKLSERLANLCSGAFAWALRYPLIPLPSGRQPLSKKFPLVLFSHGMGSCRTTYSRLCYEIASRGFTVAALEHLDGSANAAKSSPDNWIYYSSPPDPDNAAEFRLQQVRQRAAECLSVYETIKKTGEADTDKAIISGHSFGAATALYVLAEPQSPFKGAVVFDSWIPFFNKCPLVLDNAAKIKQKSLFVNCEFFQVETNLRVMEAFDNGEDNVWTLKKTGHYCQSDIPVLLNSARMGTFIRNLARSQGEDGSSFDLSVEAFQSFVRSKLFPPSSEEEMVGQIDFVKFIDANREFFFKGTDFLHKS